MDNMEIVVLVSIYLYVSLWSFMMGVYNILPDTPYRAAYNLYSVIQWLVIGIALVHMYGLTYGLLGLLFTAFFLKYITHGTLGQIYKMVFDNPLIPLTLFVLMFWINTGITAALFMV